MERMPASSSAILGFRPHTGWAAAVTLTHGAKAPVIVDRRRIAYEPHAEATRFVYHKAAEGAAADAQALVEAARATAQDAALQALKQLLSDLAAMRYSVFAAAISLLAGV